MNTSARFAPSAALALCLMAGGLSAQLPQLTPPPPCRVPLGAPGTVIPIEGVFGGRKSGPGIVVLPLDAQLDASSKGYLHRALEDLVTRELSRNAGLRVATRGSVSRALREAAGSRDSVLILLHAQYVLVGSVVETKGQQDVSMSLYRLGAGNPAWRATFSTPWALQRTVMAIAAGVERAVLGGVESLAPVRRTVNDAAYEAVAAGDVALLSPSVAAADSARAAYERAVLLDPKWAVPAVRLARAYLRLVERGGQIPRFPGVAGLNRVTVLLGRAVGLDSTLADAWVARAILARHRDPVRFTGAAVAHARAVALAPNDAEAEHEYGVTLLRLGDESGGEVHLRRALALEPNRAATLAVLSELALRREYWPEACALSNASIAAWAFDPLPYAIRARARMRLVQTRDAYSDAETAARLTNEMWVRALHTLVEAGARNDDAVRRQAFALGRAGLAPGRTLNVRDASYLAMALLAAGQRRRAVEAVRRARPLGTDLITALTDHSLSAIRSDTAVARVLRDSGDTRR